MKVGCDSLLRKPMEGVVSRKLLYREREVKRLQEQLLSIEAAINYLVDKLLKESSTGIAAKTQDILEEMKCEISFDLREISAGK